MMLRRGLRPVLATSAACATRLPTRPHALRLSSASSSSGNSDRGSDPAAGGAGQGAGRPGVDPGASSGSGSGSGSGSSLPFSLRRENVATIPNIITAGRLVLTPGIGYTLLHSNYPAALGMLVVAGLSDWVDGAIARRYPSQRSLLGTVLDPLADKALVLTVVGCMGVVGAIPPALAMVMVGKDAGMVAISLWLRYASLKRVMGGERITPAMYFDLSIPSALVRPLFIGKACTALQLLTLVVSLLHEAEFVAVPTDVLVPLWWATGLTTVATAGAYVFSRSAITFLDRHDARPPTANPPSSVRSSSPTDVRGRGGDA